MLVLKMDLMIPRLLARYLSPVPAGERNLGAGLGGATNVSSAKIADSIAHMGSFGSSRSVLVVDVVVVATVYSGSVHGPG
jgi:hypothetical protein